MDLWPKTAADVRDRSRWQVVNTWNGGAGGERVAFTSTEVGTAGHNACFKWVIDHTPFSFHEATVHQGYDVRPVTAESKEDA